MEQQKSAYQAPVVVDWGAVTDLTATGLTVPGSDDKSGSVLHSKGE